MVAGWSAGTWVTLSKGFSLLNRGLPASKYMEAAFAVGTKNSLLTGSNEGGHQFVAPPAAGHTKVPRRLGWAPERTTGRPSESIESAQVCFANGFANRNFPVLLSST